MKRRTTMLIAASMFLAPTGAAAFPATQFAVMSYNVRGLPKAVIEDRTAQIAAIAPKLEDFHTPAGSYDGQASIVLLQESFDAGYYSTLTNPATVTYAHITTKDTGGPSGIGDGLNRLSDFAFSGHTRTQWAMCFGTLGANGSDCDTNKGYSFARHEIETGVFVDVYDLHADAGQDTGSRNARRDNITQLRTALLAAPASHAVIVMGDTNSLYTRSTDNIETILSGTGLHDVWVDLVKGGTVPAKGADNTGGCDANPGGATCELVDKIFYRSGTDITLFPGSFAALKTLFSDGMGHDLSDHFPVAAVFGYELAVPPTSSTSSTSTSTTTTTTLPPRPCGDPVALVAKGEVGDDGTAAAVTAGDALRVLRAAVGSSTCETCVCDVNNSSTITAGDALLVLKAAVGQSVVLNCPAC